MGVFLETERLILRSWTDGDRDPFARLNADPRVMEFMPHPLTRAESDAAFDRIQAHFLKHGFGLFAAALNSRFSQARELDSEPRVQQAVSGPFQPPVRDDSAAIGFIGLSVPSFEAHFTPCVEIGWRLAAEHWNRGLATEGARAVVQYAFEVLRLEELVSFTVPANAGSRRVMEKLGMTFDPEGGFEHPGVPEDHPFRRHVLYRLQRPVA